MPSDCFTRDCTATVRGVSGTSCTPTTPASSSSLYDMIEEQVIETAEADTLAWERGLMSKYGISQAMVSE